MSTQAAGRGGRWGTRLLVAAGTTALLLLLLELGFRLFVPPLEVQPLRFQFSNRMEVKAREQYDVYQHHPERFWALRPGSTEPYGEDRINPLGMRGHPPAAGPTYRVVVLGDSCTYGVHTGVPYTYGGRLEARLRGLAPEAEVEVLNAGVAGYTIYQGWRLFEELVAPLEPDLVVLYHGVWNDYSPAFGVSDRTRGERGDVPGSALERAYEALSWSRLVRWFGGRFAASVRDRDHQANLDAWMAGEPLSGYRVPEDEFAEILEELLDRCAELGAEVLVILPELNVGHRTRRPLDADRSDGYRALLAAAAERRELVTLDLRELFPAPLHERLYMDFVHPSPMGYLWLAFALADTIVAEGWMSGAPPRAAGALVPPRRFTCREAEISAARGATLHFDLDFGPERAGHRFAVWSSEASRRLGLNPHPPDPPLEDAVEVAAGRLDWRGRATAVFELPGGIPKLSWLRAVGFAVRVRGARPEWTRDLWLPVVP